MAEDLRAWLGKRLREARTQAGYSSVDALARDLGFERSVISKIETGERAPSEDAAEKISGKFPGIAGGNFVDLSAVARNSERKASKYAEWFGKTWVPIEAVATGLRSFQPVIMPGLLQTEDYARVLARKSTPGASADDIQLRVDGKLERQAILERESPPYLRMILDELVLHRLIGSREIMYSQLEHLADMSERPDVVVQVIPKDIGGHGGVLGAFILADPSSTVYLDTTIDCQITGDPMVWTEMVQIFDRLTEDALSRGQSRDLIRKVAQEAWE